MRRILFVDDDPLVLDGLRVRLRPLRDRWEMVFVDSGARAIAEFERQPHDVVITDMRMPSMDGAQLLRTLSERWPATIRIVLSGYSEEAQVMRLVPYAHQYLSKPCELKQVEDVIERCLRLHQLLGRAELRAVVGRLSRIPAIPSAFAQLRRVMSREDASAQEVAQVISADPAIAGKVLQVVNSAFFRLPRNVTGIDQAVAYLGFVTIRSLVLSLEVFSAWRHHTDLCIEPERLRQHAQAVAAGAHSLMVGTAAADEALLAGLLHNIGYWVLLQECPEEMLRAIALARARPMALHEAEREVIGASHAEIGAYLLGIWGLPFPVIEAVAYHHEPQLALPAGFGVLAAVSVAHAFIEPHETDIFGLARDADAGVNEEFLARLNAPFDWAEARRRVALSLEADR